MSSLVKFLFEGQSKATKVDRSQLLSQIRSQKQTIILQDYRFQYQNNTIELESEDQYTLKSIIQQDNIVKLVRTEETYLQRVKVLINKEQEIYIPIPAKSTLSELREKLIQKSKIKFCFMIEESLIEIDDETQFQVDEILQNGCIEIQTFEDPQSLQKDANKQEQEEHKSIQQPTKQSSEITIIMDDFKQLCSLYEQFKKSEHHDIIPPIQKKINNSIEALTKLDHRIALNLYQKYSIHFDFLYNPDQFKSNQELISITQECFNENFQLLYTDYKKIRSKIIKIEEICSMIQKDQEEVLETLTPVIFEIINKGVSWKPLIDALSVVKSKNNLSYKWQIFQNNPYKFLFFLVYYNSDPSFRDVLIQSMLKYHTVPLTFPEASQDKINNKIVSELYWSLGNSNLIISLGIGGANSQPQGKSFFISDLLFADLYIHQQDKPNPFSRSTIDFFSNKDAIVGSFDDD